MSTITNVGSFVLNVLVFGALGFWVAGNIYGIVDDRLAQRRRFRTPVRPPTWHESHDAHERLERDDTLAHHDD